MEVFFIMIIRKIVLFLSIIASCVCLQGILKWNWSKINVTHVSFGKDFEWGVACSHFQAEGSHTADGVHIGNNWTQFFNIPLPVNACDHWNRFKEDIKLIADLGVDAFRFSVSWEKIEPQQGKFSEKALQHYDDVLNAMECNKIKPYICLFHHTWPTWFKGFENKQACNDFFNYAVHVFKRYHKKVRFWLTFNEPVGYALKAYYLGEYPPGIKDFKRCGQAVYNMFDLHVRLYRAFKKIDPSVQVGFAKVLQPIDSYRSWHPIERIASSTFHHLLNEVALKFFRTGKFKWKLFGKGSIKRKNKNATGALDFLGINYYSNTMLHFHTFGRKKKWVTLESLAGRPTGDSGKGVYPEGLYRMLIRASKMLPHVPLYITEFGIADKYDIKRNSFYKQHVYAIYKALQAGVRIKGAHIWTWMDTNGWKMNALDTNNQACYGLYAIDFNTQERTLRDGAKDMIYLMRHGHYC